VDGVEYAEPNRYRETSVIPNDPSFPSQWGLTKINCPAAWDRTTGSANVVVAVVDTGIDLDHPELAALLLPGTDMVDLGLNPIPPNGFHFEGDFAGRDNNPQDDVGHGTHVAGTIACASNNSVGVAGVTWMCRLLPVRVLARIVNNTDATDVRGVGSAADIAAGIRWAADNGARIINLSLGGTVDTQVERDAVAYAVSQGVVVVAAMGNAFQQGNPTSFPAAYPDVVAVGAIDQADHRAFFSQTGPHIDVAGPGVGIWSTVWDNGYTTMSGTSMAAPHVAGVAALILSCNPNLTAAQVADILRQTARPLRDNPSDPVPNDNYGFGCVDADAALQRACPPRPSVPIITCPAPSTIVRCPPSRPLITCPTVITCPPSKPVFTCPSRQIVTCGPSRLACPSVTTICPSVPAATCPRPSLTITCPSGPVCGIERPELGPDLSPFAAWGYDPYGYGTSGWEAYDPYAYWYGDEDDKGGC
jgi:subtilisin family serine protease